MTRYEYYEIIGTMQDLIEQEKQYCAGYVRNNPMDKENRERQRDMIIDGITRVMYQITKQAASHTINIQ